MTAAWDSGASSENTRVPLGSRLELNGEAELFELFHVSALLPFQVLPLEVIYAEILIFNLVPQQVPNDLQHRVRYPDQGTLFATMQQPSIFDHQITVLFVHRRPFALPSCGAHTSIA